MRKVATCKIGDKRIYENAVFSGAVQSLYKYYSTQFPVFLINNDVEQTKIANIDSDKILQKKTENFVANPIALFVTRKSRLDCRAQPEIQDLT